jgi:hypothetical protein
MRAYGETRFKDFLTLAKHSYLDAIRLSPMVYYNYFALGYVYEALGKRLYENRPVYPL